MPTGKKHFDFTCKFIFFRAITFVFALDMQSSKSDYWRRLAGLYTAMPPQLQCMPCHSEMQQHACKTLLRCQRLPDNKESKRPDTVSNCPPPTGQWKTLSLLEHCGPSRLIMDFQLGLLILSWSDRHALATCPAPKTELYRVLWKLCSNHEYHHFQ